jgi:hypothetical protein
MKKEGTEVQKKYDASLEFRVTCGDMPIVPSLMTTLLRNRGQRWIAEAAVLMRALQSDYFASSFQFLLETQLLVSAVRVEGGTERNRARIHYRILIPPKLPWVPATPHTDQKFLGVSGES